MTPESPLQSPSDALEAVARKHAAGVFRYLRSLVNDEDAARDLLQETYLRLGRHMARVSGGETIGEALVFTTARSCGLDHLRRRKVRRRHEAVLEDEVGDVAIDLSIAAPDRSVEDSQFRRDLELALARLPEEQRTVFHLSEIENRSYDAIAQVLGVSPGTIASRKHHAVRKLRDHLRRLGHEA